VSTVFKDDGTTVGTADAPQVCHRTVDGRTTLCGVPPRYGRAHGQGTCDAEGHVECVVCEDLWGSDA